MKKMNDEDKRKATLWAYVTSDEKTLANLLATDHGYGSISRVVRSALAALVHARHPKLASHLRKDIQTP